MTFEDKYNELVQTIKHLKTATKNIELSAFDEAKLINDGSVAIVNVLLNKINELEGN